MPKKILPTEEEEFEEDYEDEDEDEEPIPAPAQRGRPKKVVKKPVPALPPKSRYAWVVQQAAEALIDTETNEVIAPDIGSALANIVERLERIENAIGVMQG